MNVIRSNFDKIAPLIIEHAEQSDFISFDLELTGIKSDIAPRHFDTSFERF